MTVMNNRRALASINARFYVSVVLSAAVIHGLVGTSQFAEPALAASHIPEQANTCANALDRPDEQLRKF